MCNLGCCFDRKMRLHFLSHTESSENQFYMFQNSLLNPRIMAIVFTLPETAKNQTNYFWVYSPALRQQIPHPCRHCPSVGGTC